jgi:DNA modification methylase
LEKPILKDQIICGDATQVLQTLPDSSVDCCVTSPPYFRLRDYGIEGQIGLEESPLVYVKKLVGVFGEVKRVLKAEGTLWLVLGDCYNGSSKAGHQRMYWKKHVMFGRLGSQSVFGVPTRVEGLKHKDLIGVPWMVAFALRSEGWYLRQEIIWHKPNAMPEPVRDRCTRSHETIFMFSKQPKYYYDADAIREPCSVANIADFQRHKTFPDRSIRQGTYGEVRPDLYRRRDEYMPKDFRKNKRDVWIVNTQPTKTAHFATYPESLITPCVLAGCPLGGVVLDPFFGTGTTGVVATKNSRHYAGIDLNSNYCKLAEERIKKEQIRTPVGAQIMPKPTV